MSDNELIAEFMRNDAINSPHIIKPDYLSWGLLMPVVEKIAENYDFTIQFYDRNCNCYCTKQNLEESDIPGVGHGGFKPNIQSVYKSVVAFVKWYNSQKL
jgi:hypothetical protein